MLDESFVFGSIASLHAAVCLVASISGGTAGDIPLMRPVSVEIGADAFLTSSLLAVLSPQPVVSYSINEAYEAVSIRVPRFNETFEDSPSGFAIGMM